MLFKGIVLAGGKGTRLYPITLSTSKQLLPIYDKPMIYYPISILMLAGIKDILIISTPKDINSYMDLLGDGSRFGVKFQYKVQEKPKGLAQAFHVGKDFIGNDNVCLVLGDNIFYGQGLINILKKAVERKKGATIFGYAVANPSNFGVVEFDKNKKPKKITEKPKKPKSKYAVIGLYFYDNNVIKYAENIKPSKRGELEITSINEIYLKKKTLNLELFGRGFAWLDTGTHKDLIEAGNFISTIERRQGLKTACLEEIGYNNKWLTKKKLMLIIKKIGKNEYSDYLRAVLTN
jgi:glucose-1-phosphate thymidylyltransferase